MMTTRIPLALVAISLMAWSACAKTTAEGLGGETNWLVSCSGTAPCDEGACLCGVCSQTCAADSSCSGAFAGSCIETNSRPGQALCGADTQAIPDSVCLPTCATDVECGAGFTCEDRVCVPEPAPDPIDGNVPDGNLPDGGVSALEELENSLRTWNDRVAEMGDTYSYAEENCRGNSAEQLITVVQVEDGTARLVTTQTVTFDECLGYVNRYEDFVPATVPELYAQCETLIRREGSKVTLELDDRGLIRGCTWPGDDFCADNCGEGFYLRSLLFGVLAIDP